MTPPPDKDTFAPTVHTIGRVVTLAIGRDAMYALGRAATGTLERLRRLAEAGVWRFPSDERPGLVVANLTGYLASLSSLAFAATYAMHDATSLRPLVLGNVLSATCTAATPLFHRFGRTAAAVWLTTVFFVSLIYFTSLLGRDSGVILNLIGTSAVAFAVLGLRRVRMVFAITMVAAAIIIFCWFRYPEPAAGIVRDDAFTRQLFVTSIVSIMGIVFVVIHYAFYLTERAQTRTDELLRAIMPGEIVERLKENPGTTIAQRHDQVAVLFADVVGFTELSNRLGPERIVVLLDELFRAYDELAIRHGVEKIKTIGDAYMAVCGVPVSHAAPAEAVAAMSIGMHRATNEIAIRSGLAMRLRIGVAIGPVTAGVVGRSKYFYDVWGPAVNLAARLQTAATPGKTLASDDLRTSLVNRFTFSDRESIELKGFGMIAAWALAEPAGRES